MHACMSMDKVVQTTLPADTYTRLSERAKKEGKPLKAVVQEAIEAFLVQDLPAWEDDPLFKMIGAATGPRRTGPRRKPWKRDVMAKYRRKAAEWDRDRAARDNGIED